MDRQSLYKYTIDGNPEKQRENRKVLLKTNRNQSRHDKYLQHRNLDASPFNIKVEAADNISPSQPSSSSNIFNSKLEERVKKIKALQQRQQRSRRALAELENRPPFITAVPVGRLLPNENDFVFTFKGNNNKKQQPKQTKKRKSLHRPPFILSTRRPSIVTVDNVPRIIHTSSSLKKKTFLRSSTKSGHKNGSAVKSGKVVKQNIQKRFENASTISQMLQQKIEAAQAKKNHDLTFNTNVLTSTVQKDRKSVFAFLKDFSPISPEDAADNLNLTFTEDDVPTECPTKRLVNKQTTSTVTSHEIPSDDYTENTTLVMAPPPEIKYPDSIIKHKSKKIRDHLSKFVEETVVTPPTDVSPSNRRQVKFSKVVQPEPFNNLCYVSSVEDVTPIENVIKRRSAKSSVRSSQISETPTQMVAASVEVDELENTVPIKSSLSQLKEAEAIVISSAETEKADKRKKIKRRKVIVVDDSPDEVPRSLFNGVTPVNKNLEKVKRRTQRNSYSIDNVTQLDLVTPPSPAPNAALLVTPPVVVPVVFAEAAVSPVLNKRRRTTQHLLLVNSNTKAQDANYYYNLLDNVIVQLRESAQIWLDHKEKHNDTLPESANDMIDTVTGQTNLLINNKFEQFRKLIRLYKNNAGEKEICSNDLDGFWQMTHMQVDDLNNRFAELQRFAENNWVDPNAVQSSRPKKTPKTKKAKKPIKSSGLMEIIRLTRKLQKNAKTQETVDKPNNTLDVLMPATGEEMTVPMTPSRSRRLSVATPQRRGSHNCMGCTPQSKSTAKKSRRRTTFVRNND